MAEPLLEISDLTLEFGPISNPVRVLNHVSLSVVAGEAVGLVGESGSGKSMTSLATMRLLPASARLTSGQIRLEEMATCLRCHQSGCQTSVVATSP